MCRTIELSRARDPHHTNFVSLFDDAESSTISGEKEWYFFCLRGRKYRNSIRPNRVTGSGFWKATGIDRPIYSAAAGRAGDSIGLKKSLVFYRGSAGKGTKTEWMMHEFRLPPRSESPHTSPSEQEAVWIDMHDFSLSLSLPLSSCAYLSFSTEVYIIGKLKISEVGDKRKYQIYRNFIGGREKISDKI